MALHFRRIYLTHFIHLPGVFFYLNSLDRSISEGKNVWSMFLLLPCFIEIPTFNTNSVDRDQTPSSVAFDLGLHRLPMFL